MTIIKIEHSNSKELIQPNGRSEWKGFVIHAEIGENEDVLEAGQKLLVQMEKLHGLYGGNIYPDYSSIPGHPSYQRHEEPLPRKSEEQISREQQIEGYYQIISMATTPKQLEMHRGNIEKINDEALTRELNNKIKTLQ